MKLLVAVLLLAASADPAAAQTPYGYGLGTTGYGHGLNGSLSGRAAGPGNGSQAIGGDGVQRGGAQPTSPETGPGTPRQPGGMGVSPPPRTQPLATRP